jgi:hypothetical protein
MAKSGNKVFFWLFLLVEATAVIYLVFSIYKKSSVNVISINPIKKSTLIFEPSEDLKYFYEPKPNTIERVNDWVPYKGTYTINSDALNERRDYPVVKPPKTYRIITLGDSFTYGLYVDTKDNWTEVLEDSLNNRTCPDINKFEVINLGVHGYDTRYEIERYRKRGVKYKPDLVVWTFRDFLRIDEKLIPLTRDYQDKIDRGKIKKDKENYYQGAELAWKDIIDNFGEEKIVKYQKESLKSFNQYYSGNLLVVPFWRIKSGTEDEKILTEFVEGRDRSYFYEGLEKLPDKEMVFPNDGHPNTDGHAYIADRIYDYLTQSPILPCNGR